VSRFAAFEQTHSAWLNKPANRIAHGRVRQAKIAGELENGKPQARLPLQAAVVHQAGINSVFDQGKAQAGHEHVIPIASQICLASGFLFFMISSLSGNRS